MPFEISDFYSALPLWDLHFLRGRVCRMRYAIKEAYLHIVHNRTEFSANIMEINR